MAAARISAQAHAKKGGIRCPAKALHYSCHLAPWGYQSRDQTEYMHWNGNFAALLFINSWEYTQNLTFAREQVYPLLEGLNAWWGCFLTKTPLPGGGYVYNDASIKDPDNEHENQVCANPQIGLAFVRRSLAAQLEIAKAIGVQPDPIVRDMLEHFPELNRRRCPDLPGSTCAGQTIWTECAGHSILRSDGFSNYALWPSELVNLASSAADRVIARASVTHYWLHGHGQIKQVHLPSMMVRAGLPGNETLKVLTDFLRGNQRGSFIPRAPGGGTENLGMSVAINDMLVQAPTRDYIVLFPAWDRAQDASFNNLLVKGAVEVSAAWVAAARSIVNVSVVARPEHVGKVVLEGVGATATAACADGTRPEVTFAMGRLSFTAPPGVRCHVVEPARGGRLTQY